MISAQLIIRLLFAVAIAVIGNMIHELVSEPQPPEPRIVEVGKTLALHRMRRAGVEGDNWQDWTTTKIYGLAA